MSVQFIDRLMSHLEQSLIFNAQAKQHSVLLHNMLFGGHTVPTRVYDHACVLYETARVCYIKGDTHNARLFLIHCAQNMGMV